MIGNIQPEALRIADEFKLCSEYDSKPSIIDIEKAEAELRRLHAENTALQQGYDAARMEIDGFRDRVQELGAMLRGNCNRRIVELEAQLEAIGAGGVEPLRPRKCLHKISEPTPRRAGWLDQLGFELVEHGGVRLVVDDCGNEREASLTERVLWDALIEADGKKAAHAAVAVPDGWKLVPVEPTEDMKAAAVKYANGAAVYKNVAAEALRIEEGIYGEVYEAMLTAAPQPPAQAQEPFGYFRAEPFGWTDCASDDEGAKALYEHPATQPAPVAQGDAEDAARYRWLRENWFTMDSNYKTCISFRTNRPRWSDFSEKELDAAIDAARAQAKEGGS